MKCEKCGKNDATFHLRQVVNGDCREKHLCEACRKGYNINEFNIFNESIANDFINDGFFSNSFIEDSFADSLIEDIITTDRMLNNMIGIETNNITQVMPSMFKTSAKSENILDQAKKSIVNGAKNKEKKYAENPKLKELEKLQSELKTAVEMEDYEKAVELKKEIDKIKEQGNV